MITNPLTEVDIKYLEMRTKKAVEQFGINDLMDYTVDSYIGCDLADFYKTILEEVLIESTYVLASEISDGKYSILFEFDGKDRKSISSYAWETVEPIVENLMDNVIIPHMIRRTSTWEN